MDSILLAVFLGNGLPRGLVHVLQCPLGLTMISVAAFMILNGSVSTGLHGADPEIPPAILIAIALFPHHPSHLNIVLCDALARKASEIPRA